MAKRADDRGACRIRTPRGGAYGLGFAAFELSGGFSRQQPLTRLGQPLVAALVDHVGWPAAAIAITYPAAAVDADRSAELAARVRETAAELSRRIKGRVADARAG